VGPQRIRDSDEHPIQIAGHFLILKAQNHKALSAKKSVASRVFLRSVIMRISVDLNDELPFPA